VWLPHTLAKYSVETMSNYKETHSHKETKMKKIINTIYEIMESIGRAKAAAHLSRMGLHDEAKALMLTD
jgi:hypothetical protein